MRNLTRWGKSGVLLALTAIGIASPIARATSLINYGNFSVPASSISFLNVTESSGTDAVPLYGPPVPYTIGLDFNPAGFVSSSLSGSSDITEGQLNFTVKGIVGPSSGVAISALTVSEAGDYTLVGFGTPATQAAAGAILRVTVTEIDGTPVAPINLAPSSASVGFNLVANPGIVQPWSIGLTGSINSQLTSLGIPYTLGATKIDVSVDNALLTISEPGSISFIAKKDFVIGVLATPEGGSFPEPASLVMLLLSGPLLARRNRLG